MDEQKEPKQIVNPDHISYREYKKRLSKNPHQGLVLFISTFFILLLAFLGCAKIMSPDVDIAIGDEPEVTYEEEGIVRGNVDDRLKKIQEEDNKADTAETTIDTSLDEKVVIPEQKDEKSESDAEEAPIVLDQPQSQPVEETSKAETSAPTRAPEPEKVHPAETKATAQAENIQQTNPAPVPAPAPKTYKVYVGSYSSAAQAEVAKGIISESGAGISVFVKNINGSYTLQAGSFSTAEKAQSVANDLLKNNFPARVVAE